MVMNMMIAKIIIYTNTDLNIADAIFKLLNIENAKNIVVLIFNINNPKYSLFLFFLRNIIPFFNFFILFII